ATNQRIRAVLDQPPPKGFARWNGPLIAEALGDVDVQYIWRSLRKQKIDLGGRKSWCESKDPEFAAKAADVVGLYMAPPKNAIVICIDEKPSVQALERAQGYLKLPNGRALTVGIEVRRALHLRVRWLIQWFPTGPQSGSHHARVSASLPAIPSGGVSPTRF